MLYSVSAETLLRAPVTWHRRHGMHLLPSPQLAVWRTEEGCTALLVFSAVCVPGGRLAPIPPRQQQACGA